MEWVVKAGALWHTLVPALCSISQDPKGWRGHKWGRGRHKTRCHGLAERQDPEDEGLASVDVGVWSEGKRGCHFVPSFHEGRHIIFSSLSYSIMISNGALFIGDEGGQHEANNMALCLHLFSFFLEKPKKFH